MEPFIVLIIGILFLLSTRPVKITKNYSPYYCCPPEVDNSNQFDYYRIMNDARAAAELELLRQKALKLHKHLHDFKPWNFSCSRCGMDLAEYRGQMDHERQICSKVDVNEWILNETLNRQNSKSP